MGTHPTGTYLSDRQRRGIAFARLLSSAVFSQALLSAASFIIGLLFIRNTNDLQYAHYILASSAILLLVSLQNAFFNPPLAIRLTRLDQAGRSALIGGLHREQKRLLIIGSGALGVIIAGLWFGSVLDTGTSFLVIVSLITACAMLHREYYRMVLFAYRHSHDVLRTDIYYVLLIVAGALVATRTSAATTGTLMALALAALISGWLLARSLDMHEPMNPQGAPGILHDIAPLSMWSTSGAAVHWAFSQGYLYLVAATLDVQAVAAIAATRLLLMPVNLLSSGIGAMMLPLASGWLHRYSSTLVLRRLCLFALGLVVATLSYFACIWWLRDWLFLAVLKKQFAQRDALLLLWGAVFLVMVIRDQLVYLPAAQGRFRALTLLALASACISLVISYGSMRYFGISGALLGLLIGEMINLSGIMVLSFRTERQTVCAAVT